MTSLDPLFAALDPFLIFPYRIPDSSMTGFLLGTALLALTCVVLGRACMDLAYLWNRNHYESQSAEMVRMHNLSIKAIAARDKKSYKAANTLANESFGKEFFSRAALYAVSIWPVPFALGWMATRFSEVRFPLPGFQLDLGYTFVFIGLYIVLRILFSRLSVRLPLFSRAGALARESGRNRERMMSWTELDANPEQREPPCE